MLAPFRSRSRFSRRDHRAHRWSFFADLCMASMPVSSYCYYANARSDAKRSEKRCSELSTVRGHNRATRARNARWLQIRKVREWLDESLKGEPLKKAISPVSESPEKLRGRTTRLERIFLTRAVPRIILFASRQFPCGAAGYLKYSCHEEIPQKLTFRSLRSITVRLHSPRDRIFRSNRARYLAEAKVD